MKLKVELVPQTSWGNNLRDEANLQKHEWDILRNQCYRDANWKCEVCGGKGKKHPVECHEIWSYDDENKIQKLDGLIALCPMCHKVKHLGRSLSLNLPGVLEHFAKVNQIESEEEIEDYVVQVFTTWNKRSQHAWKLDLTWLETRPKNWF